MTLFGLGKTGWSMMRAATAHNRYKKMAAMTIDDTGSPRPAGGAVSVSLLD